MGTNILCDLAPVTTFTSILLNILDNSILNRRRRRRRPPPPPPALHCTLLYFKMMGKASMKATTLAMMAMMMMGSTAQEQEQGQGQATQVDWKKPSSLSYTIMVSETSQVVGSMSDDAPAP